MTTLNFAVDGYSYPLSEELLRKNAIITYEDNGECSVVQEGTTLSIPCERGVIYDNDSLQIMNNVLSFGISEHSLQTKIEHNTHFSGELSDCIMQMREGNVYQFVADDKNYDWYLLKVDKYNNLDYYMADFVCTSIEGIPQGNYYQTDYSSMIQNHQIRLDIQDPESCKPGLEYNPFIFKTIRDLSQTNQWYVFRVAIKQ